MASLLFGHGPTRSMHLISFSGFGFLLLVVMQRKQMQPWKLANATNNLGPAYVLFQNPEYPSVPKAV